MTVDELHDLLANSHQDPPWVADPQAMHYHPGCDCPQWPSPPADQGSGR
jgi:hypothetical protein